MIELIVKGTPYTDFTAASVTVSLESLANDFRFTASAVNAFPPFKQGDSVVVIVDGVKKLTGFIDEVNGNDQEGNHTVTYTGRDMTGDLLDSQIDRINDITASESLTLKKIIEIVIDHLGVNLKVVDNLDPAPFNKAEDVLSPEVGESAFGFIMRYASKRQALLSSTGDGNVLITQSEPTQSGATLQRLADSDTNNIISQTWTVNASERFNRYVHRGQLDPRASLFAGDTDIAAIEDQGARVTDSTVRGGRQRVVVETDSYSSAQLQDRAKWANQAAKARATRFNCAVFTHQKPSERDTAGNIISGGGVWDENTLVQINSDVADINRKMLISTLTFSEGEGQPTITSFEFVERNVYTINQKLLSQRPVGDQNDVFKTLG